MSFTLGFFVIFISLIIPGLIFRRFYFFGEFSKQFNTKDPVSHSIYFSVIPGILIQITSIIFMYYLFGIEISYTKVFNIIKDFTQEVEIIHSDTTSFLEKGIKSFFFYSVIVFIVSGIYGYVLSRIVRSFNLDKKFKLFRFKNQWYYIFSGELLSMKKFQEAIKVTYNKFDNHNKQILTTYADILVNIKDDVRELYTGFVVDYDLNSEDVTKLDRIYLIDTYRYKRINNNEDYKRREIGFNSIEFEENVDLPTRDQKRIPGNVFTLDAKNIININLTLVPNFFKEEENKKRKIKSDNFWQKCYKIIVNVLSFIMIFATIYCFTNLFSLFDCSYYDYYLNKIGFIRKVLMLFLIYQLISFCFPIQNEDSSYEYNSKSLFNKLLGFVVMILINIYNIIDFLFLMNS